MGKRKGLQHEPPTLTKTWSVDPPVLLMLVASPCDWETFVFWRSDVVLRWSSPPLTQDDGNLLSTGAHEAFQVSQEIFSLDLLETLQHVFRMCGTCVTLCVVVLSCFKVRGCLMPVPPNGKHTTLCAHRFSSPYLQRKWEARHKDRHA